MSAMRIGQFIQCVDATAGGTSTAFLNTLDALRTRPELVLRAFCTPPQAGDPAWQQIRSHPEEFTCVAGYGRALGPGPLGRAVVAAIESGEIDLLHIHGLWSPDLMAAGLACVGRNVPCVWEPHGMLAREAYAQKRWKKELFMALGMRRALTGVAALVFVTADEREQSIIPRAIGTDRTRVVPLPVTMPPMLVTHEMRAAARVRFGLPADAPVVVFMGRFHHVKRIDLAMRALASCGVPDARLLLVGGGEEEADLRSLATSLRIADRVVFAGWVMGDDKWLALAAADVLTLNSIHENFGYVAVEALCVGTAPVLTSNLAIAPELAAAGVATIAEPNERSLAEALAAALAQRNWSATLDRGGAWVREHLSPAAVGATLLALYQDALAGRVRSR